MLEITKNCIVCQQVRVINYNSDQNQVCPRCQQTIRELNQPPQECIFCGNTGDTKYWEPVQDFVCEHCKYEIITHNQNMVKGIINNIIGKAGAETEDYD